MSRFKRSLFFAIWTLGLIFCSVLFAQEEQRDSPYEKIQGLIQACARKEYANCYQLALLYLDNDDAKSILSQYASDQDFTILGVEDEDKLERIKKSSRLTRTNKEKTKTVHRITPGGITFFGERLLYLSCLNEVPSACSKLTNVCEGGNSQRSCKYKSMICQTSSAACRMIRKSEESTNSSLLLWAAIIGAGIASFVLARHIFQDEEEYQAGEKLSDEASKKDSASNHGIVLKYSWPFFKRYFSPVVSAMKNKKKINKKYKRPLSASGLSQILTPEDFFSFKLFLILGFPILFVAVREFIEEDWPLTYVPLIALLGFFYPDIWIKGKIQRRQKQIISEMPFCVDMLALSVEAGLDFIAAMVKVIEKAKPGPIVEEFESIVREIRVGSSRAESLRNMAWRVDLPEVSSFTATLIAADSVGASIGPILKQLGKEIRQKRSSELEKAGATAATKILLPMIFFIVPSVLLIIMAPVVLDYISGQ